MSDAQNKNAPESNADTANAGAADQAADTALQATTPAAEDAGTPEAAGDTATQETPADAGTSGTVVADEAPEAATQSAPKTTSSPAVARLEELAATGSASVQAVVNNLLTYIDVMAPKKPTPVEQRLQQQVTLYHTLTMIPNTLGDDFHTVWKAVLAVFDELKDGVFHEAYVFRHFDNVKLSDNQRKGFLGLLNLIKLTADPRGRALALKQVDIAKSLQYGLSDEGRNRVENFYGL